MTKEEIEQRIIELKSDYVRIQSDLEKMESVGANTERTEKVLIKIEEELKEMRKQLAKAK
ncbi:SE1832 family protein [Scopulibacillus cellulosilyticus]|uniref:SE1832 family protein n=1 Tax=Scopulibacillus cellulosilyticus TaxID=2665665 RepID=A0ABW2PXV6_9BACL